MSKLKNAFRLGDTIRHVNGKDYKIESMNKKFIVAIGLDGERKTDVIANFIKILQEIKKYDSFFLRNVFVYYNFNNHNWNYCFDNHYYK